MLKTKYNFWKFFHITRIGIILGQSQSKSVPGKVKKSGGEPPLPELPPCKIDWRRSGLQRLVQSYEDHEGEFMKEPESYRWLLEFSRQTALYESMKSLLDWDQRTYLPKGGHSHRAQQIAAITALLHRRCNGSGVRRNAGQGRSLGNPRRTVCPMKP